MAYEIERKFLLSGHQWRENASGLAIRQGYLLRDAGKTLRVRTLGQKGFLTIKGRGSGITRPEFEYEIPKSDAEFLLEGLCESPLLEKIRYRVPYEGFIWEIDEFLGENSGLFVAEIELVSEDQIFPRPQWLGMEVTGDPRYYNSNLSRCPYKVWPQTELSAR